MKVKQKKENTSKSNKTKYYCKALMKGQWEVVAAVNIDGFISLNIKVEHIKQTRYETNFKNAQEVQ